ALRTSVADVREPLGEHGFRLAREHPDRADELARQAARRILATRLHEAGELLRSVVRVRGGSALDDPFHLLDLLALHVLEPGTDARGRFHFFALDPFEQFVLAPPHSVVELVQRTPALDGMRV